MLSVIIISYNEEETIATCLQSVQWAQEIIVFDSGSTDKTVEIAKKMGAKVISSDWPGFGIQKQRALSLATQEWVLSLDADEYLSPSAQTEIQKQIQMTTTDAFILPIQMVFQGKVLKFAGLSRHLRLFRREKAKFSADLVHEKVILSPGTKQAKLHATILHQSYQDWSDALNKMNLYSTLSARSKSGTNHLMKAIIASSWMLLRNLLLKRWLFDGATGIALAVYQAQGSWYRYLKQIYPDA